MSKKKKKKQSEYTMFMDGIQNENITELDVSGLCKENMKVFGLNNNIMRHVPALYDGLKPVERRILYSMFLGNIRPNKKHKKSAIIVGSTMALHPHGDQPIYSTLTKLAQKWSVTIPLIDGAGNFGSIEGDDAAAMRYTDARLSKFAWKCYFEEFDERILDMILNNTSGEYEPEVLPAKYPVSMLYGCSGIGYGISCLIPPHNFTEICDATIQLIEDPTSDILLIPDLPTGCDIVDNGELTTINETGRGKLLMRSNIAKIADNILSIQSTPWQSSFEVILSRIVELSNEGAITGISELVNNNTEDAIDFKIVLKKEADINKFIEAMYKRTPLEDTKPVSFRLIDDYEMFSYNNKKFLLEWIDRRVEMKRRILYNDIVKLNERKHILEIILFVLREETYVKTIDTIKKANNKDEIISFLVNEFNITTLQAANIASMRLISFNKESVRGYRDELSDIEKKLSKKEKEVKSPKKILKMIIDELEEGKQLFGSPRKSAIIKLSGEVEIADTDHIIVITSNGNIKKLNDDVVGIGEIEQGDTPIQTLLCNNRDELLLFDKYGKLYRLPVNEIEGTSPDEIGYPINRYINSNGGIIRVSVRPTLEVLDKVKEPVSVVFVTKNGLIKRTIVTEYVNIKNELMAIDIKEDDALQTVKFVAGDKDIIVYTENGMGIRFNTSDIKLTGRFTKGVKALDMGNNDSVIGMEIINKNDDALVLISSKGNVKISLMDTFTVSERNSQPLKLIGLTGDEKLIFVNTKANNIEGSYNVFMKSDLLEIHTNDMVELPRMSKGKKMIPVRKGDTIINIVPKK